MGKLDTCMKFRHVYSKKIRWNGHLDFWFQRTGRSESGPKNKDNRQMSIIFYMISRQVYLDFFVHSAQNPPKISKNPPKLPKTPQKLQRTFDNSYPSLCFVNCSTMFHDRFVHSAQIASRTANQFTRPPQIDPPIRSRSRSPGLGADQPSLSFS